MVRKVTALLADKLVVNTTEGNVWFQMVGACLLLGGFTLFLTAAYASLDIILRVDLISRNLFGWFTFFWSGNILYWRGTLSLVNIRVRIQLKARTHHILGRIIPNVALRHARSTVYLVNLGPNGIRWNGIGVRHILGGLRIAPTLISIPVVAGRSHSLMLI